MKQIFILGVSRTGSKFYMQLLNSHKDVFISPELIFKHPIKKDFCTLLEVSLREGNSVEKIVDKLFDFKERLPFTRTITKIGKKKIIKALYQIKELTPYSIFDYIIRLSALHENKSIYGAKFPVHFRYSEELIDNFKDSKNLFLTRDPRAIYVSDVKKKKKESKGDYYRFKVKYFIKFLVLFYTIIEWRKSLTVYEKCIRKYSSKRIKLMKYETVINENKSVINDIATFINCSVDDFNLDEIKIVDSSYDNGISADRWKENINSLEKFVFKLLIGRKMKKYGY